MAVFVIEVDASGGVVVKNGETMEEAIPRSPSVSSDNPYSFESYDLVDFDSLAIMVLKHPNTQATRICIKRPNCDIYCG